MRIVVADSLALPLANSQPPRLTKRATKPNADFSLGLAQVIEPTRGFGAELTTLADAARFVGASSVATMGLRG
jgi:hypothetical protein